MKSRFSFLAAFLLLVATTATAETFVVNKEADDDGPCTPDDCSFREALIAANERSGFDTVIVPAGTYRVEIPGLLLTTGSFDILDDVEVLGEPGAHLVGNGEDRVVEINGSTVLLSGLEISGGRAGADGGGVRASLSDVVIRASTIRNNISGTGGGGVSSLVGNLTLIDSLVFENAASLEGGGVFGFGIPPNVARIEIVNSTISGNHALQGGGVGAFAETPVHLRNTTIFGNTADFRASAFYTDGSPPARLRNTLLVGSCSQNLPPESGGGNIESPGETCLLFDDPTDRMGVEDPGLGPLGDYGGPTWTHALLAGSPAIDTAVGSCEETDQRGVERPVDGDGDGTATCDVGAFEFVPVPIVVEVPTANRPGLWILALLLVGLGAIRVAMSSS